jgi:hypothetical protein
VALGGAAGCSGGAEERLARGWAGSRVAARAHAGPCELQAGGGVEERLARDGAGAREAATSSAEGHLAHSGAAPYYIVMRILHSILYYHAYMNAKIIPEY